MLVLWGDMVAVIDGGPSSTYTESLAPRLAELRVQRGLRGNDDLVIDWLLVSHIDGDHIGGLVSWTRDLIQPERHGFGRTAVDQLWLNTFDDIVGHRIPNGVIATAAQEDGVGSTVADRRAVVASVNQARELRDNLSRLQNYRNLAFGGGVVTAAMPGGPAHTTAFADLQVTVLGPREDALIVLQDAWKSTPLPTRESGISLGAYADTSIYNLSSIACLLEHDGTSALLTGDALGSDLLDSLRDLGFLEPSLHVDVLKVPHHGSPNSVDADFFQSITADHYILSGNGRYGNPNPSTLDLLVDTRPDDDFSLHFTYLDTGVDGHSETIREWIAAKRAQGRGFAVEQARAPEPGLTPRIRI